MGVEQKASTKAQKQSRCGSSFVVDGLLESVRFREHAALV